MFIPKFLSLHCPVHGGVGGLVVVGSAVGGRMGRRLSVCDITLKRPHDGQPNAITGFRLVQDL